MIEEDQNKQEQMTPTYYGKATNTKRINKLLSKPAMNTTQSTNLSKAIDMKFGNTNIFSMFNAQKSPIQTALATIKE